jgi:hypothetical protein
MGTFDIEQNNFLVFEPGPSENMTLQWATYRDASDQTSLSRIWGGIHPPIDDIRGRIIGDKIGNEAYNLALEYFSPTLDNEEFQVNNDFIIYPVPFTSELNINHNLNQATAYQIYGLDGKLVFQESSNQNSSIFNLKHLQSGIYFLKILNEKNEVVAIKKLVKS